MRKLICLLFSFLVIKAINAQQEYSFGYLFKKADFENGIKELYIKKGDKWESRNVEETLRGVINKRNKDTLFVSMWPGLDATGKTISIKRNDKATTKLEQKSTEDDEYIIVVKDWNPKRKKYKFIDMSFRQREFTATNIPFRLKLRDSVTLQSSFLNFNIAYLWVRGKTRIFESKFVKERNRSIAAGPFIGLSTIKNPTTFKDEFGLNYGGNIMLTLNKLNFTIALGLENGFTKETKKIIPYVGFGLGFKMVEMFEPEIKKD